MNFDLKALDLAGAAAEKCDVLVLLVPEAFKPGKDALSQTVAAARKAGDLEAAAGKQLALYHSWRGCAPRANGGRGQWLGQRSAHRADSGRRYAEIACVQACGGVPVDLGRCTCSGGLRRADTG